MDKMRSPFPRVVKPFRNRCEKFTNDIFFGNGDNPRVWSISPRHRCWNSIPRPRADVARTAGGRAACAACGTGAPVPKAVLIEAAWPGHAIEDSNLTVQIAAVRRLFEELAAGACWIETLPRRGYRYVGPAVTAGNRDPTPGGAATATLTLPDKPSVAVLPFSNLSGDPEQDYFADGMVDDIITGLARIKWLLVIARNSTFTYKGRAVDVKQIGRELGVRYVLEGSVRRACGHVRACPAR
ncbi:hypothetical protein [Mesorhizobium sp. M0644]|uniref:hypothetical protein n=1 Tax=Mesorhizobium sp. M0644 TaxID=2956979 RepID=UPI003337AD44